MTLAIRIPVLLVALTLFVSAVAPITVSAQTCNPTCTSPKRCYVFQNSPRCMTPAEYAAAQREGTVTQPSPEGTVTQPGTAQNGTLVNPLKADNLEELLAIIVQAVVRLGAIILILMLIWTGFKFVIAQGKPEEISNAKRMLLWVIIGGLVLLGAEALTEVIKSTANTL